MDGQRANVQPALESDSLSRRNVLLGIGASGLAAAFATQKIEAVFAQEATPSADSGMPEGMNFASLGGIPIPDLPTEPFTIQVGRLTLEPGVATPISSSPYPTMAYVEEGESVICPPAGEGRWVYDSEGKVVASGAGEFAFPLSTWCYTAPNTMDGVRNDGSERASFLTIDLVPTEE